MDIRLCNLNPKIVTGCSRISALPVQEYQSDNIKEPVDFPDLKPFLIETNKLTGLIERLPSSNENLSREFQIFKSKIEHQMNLFDARLKTITIQAQSNGWGCFSLVIRSLSDQYYNHLHNNSKAMFIFRLHPNQIKSYWLRDH